MTSQALAARDAGHIGEQDLEELRSPADVAAVQEGLADGTIDCIATDHAPHSAVEKDVEFEAAANGMVGLETAFAVCLELVRRGRLSEMRLVEALATAPGRTFGLPGGTLARGAAADVALLDPTAEWRVEPSRFLGKGRSTPWKGARLMGRCVQTFVDGRSVHVLKKGER